LTERIERTPKLRETAHVTATSRRRNASSSPWERFLLLPDDDRRELINGELVETEMPTELHEHIVACLTFFFRAWVRVHGGHAYASGYRVRIDARHGFFPDVQLYHPKNRAERTNQGLTDGAPDVVVEVLSEGSAAYDKKAKLLGYARIGVTEYWVVSPDEGSLERLVLRRGKYVVEEVLTSGDVLKPSRFPGLEVPVAELFALSR
jgi:Uma2 family endonuclease